MSVKLALDHPTLALKKKVQNACQQFLDTFGFNYFQYLRCFADGSFALLVNNTGLVEYFQEMDNAPLIFSSIEEEQANAHAYWFLWDEKLPEMPVQLAREKFNIRHGLTLVRRSKEYYDMIAVALPAEQPDPGSFYLNKLGAIEEFIKDFEKNNKDLIKIMNAHPIALPAPYRDVNYKKICLSAGRVKVRGKLGMSYITNQELACLRLLAQGSSHKEISQCLEISPRTVETYFSRIRQRTGFISNADIERMLTLNLA